MWCQESRSPGRYSRSREWLGCARGNGASAPMARHARGSTCRDRSRTGTGGLHPPLGAGWGLRYRAWLRSSRRPSTPAGGQGFPSRAGGVRTRCRRHPERVAHASQLVSHRARSGEDQSPHPYQSLIALDERPSNKRDAGHEHGALPDTRPGVDLLAARSKLERRNDEAELGLQPVGDHKLDGLRQELPGRCVEEVPELKGSELGIRAGFGESAQPDRLKARRRFG